MPNLGLTDEPIMSLSQESLGIKDYVDALSEFMKECQTPMTISIQADWGVGKTSMMNLVKENIATQRIKTIWFNTWQFSQFNMSEELGVSLLKQFVKRIGGEDSNELIKKISALGKRASILFAKAALGNAASALMSGGEKIMEGLSNDELDDSEQIVKLKSDLETTVKKRMQKESLERIVVFIDDLDRLEPKKAVELLEIMKLFLDIPGCVFVLAVDYGVIVNGLKAKFGDNFDDAKSKSFFDKIIQLPFNLPVSQYDIKGYFRKLLNLNNDNEIEVFVKLANASLGFNPRGMKRLFNSLELLKMVAKSKNLLDDDEIATGNEKQRILFGILCLQTSFESLYKFILKNNDKIESIFDAFSENETTENLQFLEHIINQIKVNKEGTNKIKDFLDTLYVALQLKSDTQNGENLSQSEIDNFLKLLSFSSITSVDNTDVSTYNSGGSQIILKNAKEFLEKQNLSFSPDVFSKGTFVFTCFKLVLLGFGVNLVVGLEEKSCGIWLDDLSQNILSKRFIKQLFDQNFNKNFTYNGRAKYGFLIFEQKELPVEQNERVKLYIEFLQKALNTYLPFFEKYANTTDKFLTISNKFSQNILAKIQDDLGEKPIFNHWEIGGIADIAIKIKGDKAPFIRIYNQNLFNLPILVGIKRAVWGQNYEKERDLFNALKTKFSSCFSDKEYICVLPIKFPKSHINLYDFNDILQNNIEDTDAFEKNILNTVATFINETKNYDLNTHE